MRKWCVLKIKNKCPCCENNTLYEKPPGTFEICPICNWEDDEVQYNDPTYTNALYNQDMEIIVNLGGVDNPMLAAQRALPIQEVQQIGNCYELR